MLRIASAAVLSFMFAWSAHAEQFKVDVKREHIKSVSIVAPLWEDFTNADGTGLYWQVLQEIYQPEGVKLRHKTVPWNRAIKMVSKYHLYNAIVGEYREDQEDLLFPDYPIDVEYLSVIVRPGLKFEDMSSLTGKSVGWIKDYELIDDEDIDFTLKEFRDLNQGMALLKAGVLDYVIDEWDEIALAMQQHHLSEDTYSVGQLPEGTDVYVAFNKSSVSETLIKIYNERVEQLVKSGRMAAIYQQSGVGEMPETLMAIGGKAVDNSATASLR